MISSFRVQKYKKSHFGCKDTRNLRNLMYLGYGENEPIYFYSSLAHSK